MLKFGPDRGKIELARKSYAPTELVFWIDNETCDIHLGISIPKTGDLLYVILADSEDESDMFSCSKVTILGHTMDITALRTPKEMAFSKIIKDRLEAASNVATRDEDGFIILMPYQPKPQIRITIADRRGWKQIKSEHLAATHEYLRALIAEIQLDNRIDVRNKLIDCYARPSTTAIMLRNVLIDTIASDIGANYVVIQAIADRYMKRFDRYDYAVSV